MKKVAFISENCYVHIDFTLLPLLKNNIIIGWFPYFNSEISENVIDAFLNKAQEVEKNCFQYMQLTNRMRDKSTYKEFEFFLNQVKKWNPELIYVNADGFPWLPVLLRKYFDKQMIFAAIHDVKAHTGTSMKTHIYKKLLPRFYKNLNTYSKYSFQQLQRIYATGKNISCCMHPLIDYGVMIPKEHEKITFMFFGNFIKYKGIDILLEAGVEAYKHNQNIKIKICGSGNKSAALVRYGDCPVFEINNRYIDDCEIPGLLSDVDCLVLPYRDATQSGPLMIALNYGIRILVSDIPAFQWFVDNFSGVVSVKNTVDKWSKALANYSIKGFDSQQYTKQINEYRNEVENSWNQLFIR